jgi:hypothetical protein
MATEAKGRGASELRYRSRGMAFATPRSAAVVDGLATAAGNDASLNALLGQGWLDRPLAGMRLLAGVHGLVLTGKAPELKALMYSDPDAALPGGDVLWKITRQAIFDHPDEMRAASRRPRRPCRVDPPAE